MARGVDNTRPLSDGAVYFIIDDLGRRQLRQVQTHSVQTEGGLSVVTGPSGVLGKVRAAGGYSLTLTVRHAAGVRDEVAWNTLLDTDASFTLEIQYKRGQRKIFRDCGVSTISDSAGEDGNVTFEVSLMATKREIVESATA
jgi:hypothetical protein